MNVPVRSLQRPAVSFHLTFRRPCGAAVGRGAAEVAGAAGGGRGRGLAPIRATSGRRATGTPSRFQRRSVDSETSSFYAARFGPRAATSFATFLAPIALRALPIGLQAGAHGRARSGGARARRRGVVLGVGRLGHYLQEAFVGETKLGMHAQAEGARKAREVSDAKGEACAVIEGEAHAESVFGEDPRGDTAFADHLGSAVDGDLFDQEIAVDDAFWNDEEPAAKGFGRGDEEVDGRGSGDAVVEEVKMPARRAFFVREESRHEDFFGGRAVRDEQGDGLRLLARAIAYEESLSPGSALPDD